MNINFKLRQQNKEIPHSVFVLATEVVSFNVQNKTYSNSAPQIAHGKPLASLLECFIIFKESKFVSENILYPVINYLNDSKERTIQFISRCFYLWVNINFIDCFTSNYKKSNQNADKENGLKIKS